MVYIATILRLRGLLIRNFLLESIEIISHLTTVFLMGILYYILFTPFSLIYRVFRRDRLHLKRSLVEKSYFVVRDHTYNSSDMEKM